MLAEDGWENGGHEDSAAIVKTLNAVSTAA